MPSFETVGLDPSLPPDEARWHDSVMKSFACDPEYADIYVPNEEDLRFCPDPDPKQFLANSYRSGYHTNDVLHEYADQFEGLKTLHDLPWAVRYLFSKGYTPDTAKVYLGEFALRSLLAGSNALAAFPDNFHALARAFSNIPFLDLMEGIATLAASDAPLKPRQEEPALIVIQGIRVGKIIQEPEKIRGSISNQFLATVDVGPVLEDATSEESAFPQIKRIVCAGIPVIQNGDLVAVALPGALVVKHANTPRGIKIEKVRARGFNIGRRKYRSEGLVLSHAEACASIGQCSGAFKDLRESAVHEVLKIPRLPGLYPGRSLDGVELGKFGNLERGDPSRYLEERHWGIFMGRGLVVKDQNAIVQRYRDYLKNDT